MRVALVLGAITPIPLTRRGSVEEYVFQLCKRLPQFGVEAMALTGSSTQPGLTRFDGCLVLKVRTPSTPINFPKMDFLKGLAFGYEAAKKLKLEDCDVVHANKASSGFILARMLKRDKLVYTCHNGFWTHERVHLGEKIVRMVEGHAIKGSAKVIALNRTMRESLKLKLGLDDGKLVTVPLGVDTDYFRPDVPTAQVEEKYGLKGKTVILFVGKISFWKGVHVLLKAYKHLLEKKGLRDLKLVIVGPLSGTFSKSEASPYALQVLDFARRSLPNDSYVFTDAISRGETLRQLYARSDVLVLPSCVEAFGMVLVAAMASGTALIGSRTGGIVDVIEDGVNGYTFEPGNHQELSYKISTMISDESLLSRIKNNSRRIAEERYDWDAVAREVCEKVYKVIGSK